MSNSIKSEETKKSINIRCQKLLSHDFFKTFPVVIVAYSGGYPFSISGDIRSVPS